MELDHFSQFYIYSKHMQRNEWCQCQGDKWEHFRCAKQFFDVIEHQRHQYNHRENCDHKGQCELDFIVLERNFSDQFKTAFRISEEEHFSWEFLFAKKDLQDIRVSY